MNNKIKKITSIFMSVALVAVMALSAPVETQAAFSPEKSVTLYATKTSEYTSFSVSGMPAGEDLDIPSVKSSNTSVATIREVYASNSNGDYDNGYANIYLTIKKFGTTTVSYKVGKKTYKTKVTIEKLDDSSSSKYTNPLSSVIVSGVNSGKSFASKFDKDSYIKDYLSLSKTQDNGKIEIKTKSGWKIQNIELHSYSKNLVHSISKYNFNASTATLDSLQFKKDSANTYYYVGISLSDKDGLYHYMSFGFK